MMKRGLRQLLLGQRGVAATDSLLAGAVAITVAVTVAKAAGFETTNITSNIKEAIASATGLGGGGGGGGGGRGERTDRAGLPMRPLATEDDQDVGNGDVDWGGQDYASNDQGTMPGIQLVNTDIDMDGQQQEFFEDPDGTKWTCAYEEGSTTCQKGFFQVDDNGKIISNTAVANNNAGNDGPGGPFVVGPDGRKHPLHEGADRDSVAALFDAGASIEVTDANGEVRTLSSLDEYDAYMNENSGETTGVFVLGGEEHPLDWEDRDRVEALLESGATVKLTDSDGNVHTIHTMGGYDMFISEESGRGMEVADVAIKRGGLTEQRDRLSKAEALQVVADGGEVIFTDAKGAQFTTNTKEGVDWFYGKNGTDPKLAEREALDGKPAARWTAHVTYMDDNGRERTKSFDHDERDELAAFLEENGGAITQPLDVDVYRIDGTSTTLTSGEADAWNRGSDFVKNPASADAKVELVFEDGTAVELETETDLWAGMEVVEQAQATGENTSLRITPDGSDVALNEDETKQFLAGAAGEPATNVDDQTTTAELAHLGSGGGGSGDPAATDSSLDGVDFEAGGYVINDDVTTDTLTEGPDGYTGDPTIFSPTATRDEEVAIAATNRSNSTSTRRQTAEADQPPTRRRERRASRDPQGEGPAALPGPSRAEGLAANQGSGGTHPNGGQGGGDYHRDVTPAGTAEGPAPSGSRSVFAGIGSFLKGLPGIGPVLGGIASIFTGGGGGDVQVAGSGQGNGSTTAPPNSQGGRQDVASADTGGYFRTSPAEQSSEPRNPPSDTTSGDHSAPPERGDGRFMAGPGQDADDTNRSAGGGGGTYSFDQFAGWIGGFFG